MRGMSSDSPGVTAEMCEESYLPGVGGEGEPREVWTGKLVPFLSRPGRADARSCSSVRKKTQKEEGPSLV